MKKISFTTGFTMVETLVAVAILMIAIAGPLTIAQKGLTAAVYARDQVTASFLAQDAMEYIKNVRDYNVANNPDNWLELINNCTQASLCPVDTTKARNSAFVNPTGFFKLYTSDDRGYTAEDIGDESQFSRSFYIDQNPTPPQANLNSGYEATVVVMVSWNNGTVSNVVTFENQIFNITR